MNIDDVVKEVQYVVKTIRHSILDKDDYEKAVWEAIVELIEISGFGQNPARIEFRVPIRPESHSVVDTAGAGFADTVSNIQDIFNAIFSGLGHVIATQSVSPHEDRTVYFQFLPR